MYTYFSIFQVVTFSRRFCSKILLVPRELQILGCSRLTTDASSPGVVAALHSADANHLAHLTPEADRRAVEGLLVSINGRTLPDQINLVCLSELRALQ
jgi:hypothetical protein